MRTCRICCRVDTLHDMLPLFENIELILELNYLANISIVEVEKEQALICKRCIKSLKQAVEFKKLCIESTLTFKKTSNEHYEWFNNYRSLKVNSTEKVPETREICHQSPFVSDERFKDYLADSIINEPLQSNNENVEDTVQFSQIEDAKSNDNDESHLNFIDNLTDQQLEELTIEISNLIQLCTVQKETPSAILNIKTSTLLNGNRNRTSNRSGIKRNVITVSPAAITNTNKIKH
ncbi:hypothetical protein PVAND_012500 [Polypedilum vanderplanki]|uniref:ZAD domain-containing protein n=1 Tax=Polypedilum vanderplanki TaxID=319348 RepID=A0A9J6CMQ1_POLVA|nr:hypothetical protein PVAND_012500 [Polypedilum vanderplanki]